MEQIAFIDIYWTHLRYFSAKVVIQMDGVRMQT